MAPETMEDFDKAYLEKLRFDLRCAMTHGEKADWWSVQMFRLIAKSDSMHKARLARCFPEYVMVYDEWYDGKAEVTDAE